MILMSFNSPGEMRLITLFALFRMVGTFVAVLLACILYAKWMKHVAIPSGDESENKNLSEEADDDTV